MNTAIIPTIPVCCFVLAMRKHSAALCCAVGETVSDYGITYDCNPQCVKHFYEDYLKDNKGCY